MNKNREDWAEASKKIIRGSELDNGCSDTEWAQGWEKLKENGVYEVDYFGDVFLFGMNLELQNNSNII